ncbi:MAG TPA: haloacid dehalogenase type II [Rhizomicrobium sp.]|jgi:2-haloacid dehalogenase|nr:haloacid dehalogenase type II [Rhizomicrobium sp.]
MQKLTGIRACVFDAYGTVFDFASAAARCPDVPAAQRAALTTLWRDKQLQYTWLRTLQDRYVDFAAVTRDALDFALETLGLPAELSTPLMALYYKLDAFAEVPDMLHRLRAMGFSTAILSNGAPAMLDASITHAGLNGLFDAVLSVDSVKAFKTSPKVYQIAVDTLRVPAEAIAFQSSNGWDAYAASAFGMRVVWCNRYAQRPERLPGKPDIEIKTLAELPELLER